ncbi:GDSL esterase/lipase At2g04570-like [Typha angustifolia]|uniref:GDSL esterase/lipase At2g04570-like n=1 Tax=Typha angustifolia TaxID=59011 RepID=UPI003C2F47F4
MNMSSRYSLWLVLLGLLSLYTIKATAKVPTIVVFGDSSVDSGNNDYILTAAKANFRPYGCDFDNGEPTGRFSNGRLATDYLSKAFGLPSVVPAYLDPDYGIEQFASGVCFASASTGLDNATADIFIVIPIWQQLEYYKEYRERLKSYQGEAKARETLSEALYIVSIGTNDFIENYYSPRSDRSSQFTVPEYEEFLLGIAEGFLRELHALGGRKIDVTSLPPMGCLPLTRLTNSKAVGFCNEEYNALARDFNVKLRRLVRRLNGELPGAKIVYGNVYDFFADVVQNPLSYEFRNSLTGCCGTGLFETSFLCNAKSFTCPDADEFVFWDSIHPTDRMNHLIADQIMNSTLYIFL